MANITPTANTAIHTNKISTTANKRLASLPFSWFVEVLFSISNLFFKLKFSIPKSATNANRQYGMHKFKKTASVHLFAVLLF